jgi:glucosamine-6-phosphate deaminase
MADVLKNDLYRWCKIPARDLPNHPALKIKFRMVADSAEMGQWMAKEVADLVDARNQQKLSTRAIVPCGPKCWYGPFTQLVNTRRISLKNLFVFHMDECLDWQGRTLPAKHPYNFRTFMEEHFYSGIRPELAVPENQRFWLLPQTADRVRKEIDKEKIDITLGGWGQDGHVAYNQARRNPYSSITLEELAGSSIRIQENNIDTVLALAQRTFGGAYQFVPPMSITLGVRECLSASKVRVFSDTGSWKQTALRVALFSEPTPEYPMTLLQQHPDAIITATKETASHPISENPEWRLLEEGAADANAEN